MYNKNTKESTPLNWEKVKHGVPQDSVIWPLLFLICINYLPPLINNKSTPVLFSDDTSILITHSKFTGFKSYMIMVLETLNNWFNTFLSLNFEKTQFTHFTTKNNMPNNIQIGVDKIFPNATCIKFLGLTIDNL
jgi:hypothetical protein